MTFLIETDWKISAIEKTEPAICYWESDIPYAEIIEAYSLPKHINTALKYFGLGRLEGLPCKLCAGPITLTSRNNAKERVQNLSESGWERYADWAQPNICPTCKDRLYRERDRAHFLRHEARRARQQQLKTMPYRDYLQTEEWQATRKDALRRARFSCQTCSAKGVLHVHHRTYVRRGAESSSDLIVLCGDCHSLFHKNAKLAEGGRAA